MKVFLVGFMGSGKTTLGKKLALHMSYSFVDMDKEIETELGMSIAEYFRQFGEDAFRKIESDVLKKSSVSDNTIIATGGGAPCFFDNMEWMNDNGITVYLSLPPKALAKRLENATDERPVLGGLRGAELESFIADKLSSREGFYNKAVLVVSGMDLTAGKLSTIIYRHYLR